MDETGAHEPGFDLGPEPVTKTPSYRVLARKYRPSSFDDLIGQEALVRTLTNAFETGRIAQAYMFTGVRGVGKTTTARILARALNYELPGSVEKPSVVMKEVGTHCQAIMEGRHVDVIEIDAASHTGIDDVRQITDGARYAPVSARYKVYIVDEVHMLSDKAWNAFLKTLEEPPPHVKFMFATTEIRKVPVTVLSRCQRFDLRRVETDVIVGHLARLAGLEKITVATEALSLIARASEGSVRDSLSMLDQAIAHGGGMVEADAVRQMLGLADRSRVIALFEELMRGDMPSALTTMKDLYHDGADPAGILTELAEFTHLLTRIKVLPKVAEDVALSPVEREKGQALSGTLSMRILSRTWQMLMKGIGEVESSSRPLASAEMVLVRIAYAADLPTPDEALKLLMEGGLPAGQGSAPAGAPPRNGPTAMTPNPPARMQAISGGNTAQALSQPVQAVQTGPQLTTLEAIARYAGEKRDIRLKFDIESYIRPVHVEHGKIDCALLPGAPPSLLNDLTRKLGEWTGSRWMISLSREEGSTTLREIEAERKAELDRGVRSHPDVQAVLTRFPGAEIVAVRPLGEAEAEPSLAQSDEDIDMDQWEPVAPWDDDF